MCMLAKLLQSYPTLRPCGLKPTKLLCPCDSLGKNTGVGCHALLQGVFLDHRVSCVAGRFFTTEPPVSPYIYMWILYVCLLYLQQKSIGILCKYIVLILYINIYKYITHAYITCIYQIRSDQISLSVVSDSL